MPETTVEQCIEQLQAWCRDPTLKIAHSALHRTGAAGKGAFAEVDTATWNQETQREETDAANQPPSPSLSSALSNKIMASRPVASSSQITVAVKRFKPEVLANDTNLKLLVSEIGILLSTRHRHIIQVYGLGTRGDGSDIRRSLYLVQEYAPGGTMKRLIMEQMMNWNAFGITGADLLEWCHQLASVLAYLHGKSPPIVHRDIKSENILFSAPLAQWGMPKRQKSMSGRIKNLPTTAAEVRLIDFGLARRLPTVTKQIQAETPIVEQGSARNIEKEMAWTKSFKSVKSLRIIADAASANGPSSNHPSREPSVRHSSASKSRTEKRGVSFSNVSVTRKHVSLGGAAVAGVADDQSFSDKRKSPLAEDQPSFSPTGQDLPSTSLYSNAATPASDASPLLAAATAAEGKEAVPLISPAKGDFNPFAPYLPSSGHALTQNTSTRNLGHGGSPYLAPLMEETVGASPLTSQSPRTNAEATSSETVDEGEPMSPRWTCANNNNEQRVLGQYVVPSSSLAELSSAQTEHLQATASRTTTVPMQSIENPLASHPHPDPRQALFPNASAHSGSENTNNSAGMSAVQSSSSGMQKSGTGSSSITPSGSMVVRGTQHLSLRGDEVGLSPVMSEPVVPGSLAQGAGSNPNSLRRTMSRRTPSGASRAFTTESSRGSLDRITSVKAALSTVKSMVRLTSTPSAERVQELFDLTGNTGSLLYMAPEVFKGQSYNEKVDVFSFAMVMYELLHRRLILTSILEKNMGADVEEMEQAIVDYAAAVAGGYRPPLSPNLPDSILNLLSMCWSDKPEDRPSAEAIADKLARILETEDISSLNKSPQGGCGCCG